jgi:hypothetical protein
VILQRLADQAEIDCLQIEHIISFISLDGGDLSSEASGACKESAGSVDMGRIAVCASGCRFLGATIVRLLAGSRPLRLP